MRTKYLPSDVAWQQQSQSFLTSLPVRDSRSCQKPADSQHGALASELVQTQARLYLGYVTQAQRCVVLVCRKQRRQCMRASVCLR